jgi:catecholate siderophore receptor
MFRVRTLAAVIALAFSIGTAIAAPVAFDQPAQPLGDALKQFARTAGVTLSVDSSLVANKTAPALQESMEPEQALNRLLEGSGLEAAPSSAGFIVRSPNSGASEQLMPAVQVEGFAEQDVSLDPVKGYEAKRTVTATKTDTPLKDIPQSITVITKDAIKDQNMRSMGDVVRYVPGMNMAQGEGNRDQLSIRGQNTTADFFVDGLRDDVQYFRDFYNVERVEALKGPNAMIFGRGGGGGVINRVEKSAGWDPVRDVSLMGGSFNTKRGSVDFGQALNEVAAIRLNAMYEDSESYRDFVELERYGINPTMTFALGPQTTLKIGYEYFHDERTADRGVPSLQNSGRPFDTDPATFFGDPDQSVSEVTLNVINALVEHTFDNALLLRNRTRYGDYDKFYQNVYAGSAVSATTGNLTLDAYNNDTQRENVFNQTDLIYDLQTGSIKHRLLGGIEIGHQDTTNFRNTGFFSNGPTTLTVPGSNPTVFGTPITFRQNTNDANNRTKTDVFGVYVQDQIELSKHWEVLAGVRFDRFSVDFHNNRNGQDLGRDDDLVSPRLGIVFKPVDPLSIYASYSVSYLPSSGDQFGSLTVTTQTLEPEEFTNYEIGAKWDIREDLSLAGAVFQLDRTNTSAPDPNNGALVVQTGEQRSKGFELGLTGAITSSWEVMLAYTYQDATLLTNTTASPTGAGKAVAGVPMHTASLWNRYQFTPVWGAGVGIIYQGDMFAAIDNTVTVPEFTRVDAAVYWAINKTFGAQLNVVNLLDEEHYVSAHNNNNITPGMPRGAFVTINAAF